METVQNSDRICGICIAAVVKIRNLSVSLQAEIFIKTYKI